MHVVANPLTSIGFSPPLPLLVARTPKATVTSAAAVGRSRCRRAWTVSAHGHVKRARDSWVEEACTCKEGKKFMGRGGGGSEETRVRRGSNVLSSVWA